MAFVFGIGSLFAAQFGKKPFELPPAYTDNDLQTATGSVLREDYQGREVWLPVKFVNLDSAIFTGGELLLPFASVERKARKEYVRTPLSQRKGTVKELYSHGDFAITIKGFMIDLEARQFPEDQIKALQNLYEINESIELDNALTNLMLPDNDLDDRYKPVVINSLEWPEQKGQKENYRPFIMRIESDEVFTLEVD